MCNIDMLDVSILLSNLDAQLNILVNASDKLIQSLSRDNIARVDERIVGLVYKGDGKETLLLQVDFVNTSERSAR